VCINDDDFVTEGSRESQQPPGASGCPKPRPPANSHLRVRGHKSWNFYVTSSFLLPSTNVQLFPSNSRSISANMIMEITRSLFASLVLSCMDTSSFIVCRMALGRNPKDSALVSHRNADIISKQNCLWSESSFWPFESESFHSRCSLVIPEKVCVKPTVPVGMKIYPDKVEYKVGSDIMLACLESGMSPSGRLSYSCGKSLVWEPSIPQDIHCKIGTFTE